MIRLITHGLLYTRLWYLANAMSLVAVHYIFSAETSAFDDFEDVIGINEVWSYVTVDIHDIYFKLTTLRLAYVFFLCVCLGREFGYLPLYPSFVGHDLPFCGSNLGISKKLGMCRRFC